MHEFSVKTKVRNLTGFAFLKSVVFILGKLSRFKKELGKVVVDENRVL